MGGRQRFSEREIEESEAIRHRLGTTPQHPGLRCTVYHFKGSGALYQGFGDFPVVVSAFGQRPDLRAAPENCIFFL